MRVANDAHVEDRVVGEFEGEHAEWPGRRVHSHARIAVDAHERVGDFGREGRLALDADEESGDLGRAVDRLARRCDVAAAVGVEDRVG